VYVAPSDRHLLVGLGDVTLSRGPKENGTRPAADPMFRSLAVAWGPKAIAVVLSGALDDGSAGAVVVAAAGGTVVVQDPNVAPARGMPAAGIAADTPERILPAAEIAAVLEELVAEPVPDPKGDPDMSEPVQPDPEPTRPDGPPSSFTCPECSGALWELREGELVRYRCRVGHSYSEEAMIDAQGTTVEAALWSALEMLEERGELVERIANRMGGRTPRSEHRFRAGAREAHDRAALIRRALLIGGDLHLPGRGEEEAAGA